MELRAPFTVNLEERTCFPTNTDFGELRDITCVGDAWRKFVQASTGKVVDCAEFARLAFGEPADPPTRA